MAERMKAYLGLALTIPALLLVIMGWTVSHAESRLGLSDPSSDLVVQKTGIWYNKIGGNLLALTYHTIHICTILHPFQPSFHQNLQEKQLLLAYFPSILTSKQEDMADQRDQSALPLSTEPACSIANTDEESATLHSSQSQEPRRKKRIKTLVLVAFSLTILRARTPKYRLNSISIEDLNLTNSSGSPSFNMKFNAEVAIKNRNFGPYRFRDCYMTFSYRGKRVGEAIITEASAKVLSTKKIVVRLNVTSNAVSSDQSLGRDIASGRLVLTSRSEMRGQVDLMKLKVLKKDRTARMNCSMTTKVMIVASTPFTNERCDHAAYT
ncbi:hypothetical protein RJ639_020821 [Escallonia herrerae]|uniref:Late embryogenesis abundant protein LEA-2 subgroup domain-containing protein n=1 Tax=Escallonia herrerae TaxID=1293975 RepID=A0AA89AFD4_9ASTE|nr:hypothetical protein RJ639_020821 [Escallonia herrerae]